MQPAIEEGNTMKHAILAACVALTGCASTWHPFSDEPAGHVASDAYDECMSREWLPTKWAEERCLEAAKKAVNEMIKKDLHR